MIAIVTDRPNVGREIARVLGAGRKENGYMTGNGYMVTWTYGGLAPGGQFKLCHLQGGRLRKQFAGQGTDTRTGGDMQTVPGKGEPHAG